MAPLIGVWSDRTVSPYGKRRPWLWAGLVINIVFLGTMWYMFLLIER